MSLVYHMLARYTDENSIKPLLVKLKFARKSSFWCCWCHWCTTCLCGTQNKTAFTRCWLSQVRLKFDRKSSFLVLLVSLVYHMLARYTDENSINPLLVKLKFDRKSSIWSCWCRWCTTCWRGTQMKIALTLCWLSKVRLKFDRKSSFWCCWCHRCTTCLCGTQNKTALTLCWLS